LIVLVLLGVPLRAVSHAAPNAVTDWASIVQPALQAGRPATSAEVLHAMVSLAIYDAVVAIEGGYQPFAADISASPDADVRAAIATAAYATARGRVVPSQYQYLDEQYAAYMATIPAGQAKTEGILAGQEAAAALLAFRQGDGLDDVEFYACSSAPPPAGEFEPDTGCPTGPADPQPIDVKLATVRPFTFTDPAGARPNGPNPTTSAAYTADFIETRDYGRIDSTVRSAAQTDVAYFWADNPYIFWNRNLVGLAIRYDLGVLDTARLFALVHTTVADAVIAGFEAKYHYRSWRPRTAIPRADTDGNPDTQADPAWKPLLSVNHPEYPSGHAFWSTALTDAVAVFFGTNKVQWTLVCAVPQVVQKERTYRDLNALMREVDNARVWAGLHWRHTMRHGAQLARRVVRHVSRNFFLPAR
jgi:hypothetical protein